MNWNAAIRTLCACVATAAVCILCWTLMRQTQQVADAFTATAKAVPDLAGTVTRMNTALDKVNRGCAPGPCGPIDAATKMITKAGDTFVTTQLQEQAATKRVNATMDAIATIPEHVNMSADAATGTLAQAQVDLSSLNTTIKGVAPVLLHADDALGDIDGFIKDNSPLVHTNLVNVAGMTNSGNLMLIDAQWKTHELLHPDKVRLGFWGATWAGIKAIHSIEPPLF